MFYNQVKWLEIRAILSNLVLRPPEPIPVPLSFLPSFLPLPQSVFFRSSSGLSHPWTRAFEEEREGCPRPAFARTDPESDLYA